MDNDQSTAAEIDLDDLRIQPGLPRPITTPSGLNIIEQGKVVPLEDGVELKTKLSNWDIDFRQVASQLWSTQTQARGDEFHEVYEDDVAESIEDWEYDNRRNMDKLQGR